MRRSRWTPPIAGLVALACMLVAAGCGGTSSGSGGGDKLTLVAYSTPKEAYAQIIPAFGKTPAGNFSVYSKATMSWSKPFKTWLPFASYFIGGYALHEYPVVPGYPASHGCVRMPSTEAKRVYAYATVGMPVFVA